MTLFAHAHCLLHSYQGHMVTAEALLEVGADHSLCSSRGTTPLHAACYYAHEPVVRALLRGGADGSVMDAGGMKPGESFSDKACAMALHSKCQCSVATLTKVIVSLLCCCWYQ